VIQTDRFSYICNQCGRCCHDQVITLAPYDLLRIARAAGISTFEARQRYTLRRGSVLRFDPDGACAALDGARCSLRDGRPLACRLYPLGFEREPDGSENFIRLEPARGSFGVYGADATVAAFLETQGVAEYFAARDEYRRVLCSMRERIEQLADFTIIEPREFWRIAIREALAETNFDPNPLIDALYDPDRFAAGHESASATVRAHIDALEDLINREADSTLLGAAAALLAVSLGYATTGWAANRA
jgi:Fe-S-cluster containining protein